VGHLACYIVASLVTLAGVLFRRRRLVAQASKSKAQSDLDPVAHFADAT
jgi:hypothetical protein